MTTLYLDRRHLSLTVAQGRLIVHEQQERRWAYPLKHLERVVIHHTTQLDTGVLTALAEAGCTTLIINARHSQRVALILGKAHNEAAIRLAQARWVLERPESLQLAQSLVKAKLLRQRALLAHAQNLRPDLRHALHTGIEQLNTALAHLDGHDELDVARLRGMEGAAARAYYQAYGALFAPSLGFAGRNRRPPRDPVNAALSLGYTLLHFEAVRAAHAAGLDPMLGFYHRPAFGRESLASDLIEPLRPLLDQWVWTLFRDQTLRDEHFGREGPACLLGKAGRERFYSAWEEDAPRHRRWLRMQCQRLARRLKEEGQPLLEIDNAENDA